jgi:hypothetical protein
MLSMPTKDIGITRYRRIRFVTFMVSSICAHDHAYEKARGVSLGASATKIGDASAMKKGRQEYIQRPHRAQNTLELK